MNCPVIWGVIFFGKDSSFGDNQEKLGTSFLGEFGGITGVYGIILRDTFF